jgi:hypothetical protein
MLARVAIPRRRVNIAEIGAAFHLDERLASRFVDDAERIRSAGSSPYRQGWTEARESLLAWT